MRVAHLAASTLTIAACGRVSFEEDRRGGDAASDDAPPGSVAYVKPFAQRHPGAGATDSFMAQADAAGNAIAMQVACADPTVPTVTVSSPGWTFSQPAGMQTIGNLHGVPVIAIAPDTAPALISISWSVTCSGGKSALGDEFTDNEPTLAAFSAHVEVTGTMNNCNSVITTPEANDAVWSACFTSNAVSAVGPGYTKAADNGGGDWAAYKLTMAPAGTIENPTFMNMTSWVASTLTIRPR
ncbi:MAG TPA: hypothetical protein VL326_17255 [Kofleriaceae bacterium]|nr:hypothetical protein [Kofleriaceae bacterium]